MQTTTEVNTIGSMLDTAKLLEREFDAKDTLYVLKQSGPVFMSWGPSEFVAGNGEYFRFKVNGAIHKGYVYITLNFMDLYKVYIVNKDYTIKNIVDDVFFEDLADVIDREIETADNYGRGN